jgi:HSP20 family protein
MQDVLELKSRINTLFEELLARAEPGQPVSGNGEWTPKVDMYDLPERIVLRADVPGVAPDDLELRIESRQLILRGTRQQPRDIETEGLCRLERPFGSFVRRYALPETVDPEQVTASTQNGVLEIVIRKREASTARRISVRSS